MKIRRILIATKNNNKLMEFKNSLGVNYGIDIVKIDPMIIRLSKSELILEKANEYTDDKFNVVAIISEESKLYDSKGFNRRTYKDGSILHNTSKLTVAEIYEDKIIFNEYSHSIEGYIDLSKKIHNEEVFGWDDIFISLKTGFSYNEMRKLDLKISSRDQVISKWISDIFHYKERIDLNWNPTNQTEVISFDSEKKILSNPLFDLKILKHQGLDNKLKEIIDNGVFFRSASNRIQKNYWLPGLNAGIPLVPKKDAVHEATFQMHDFMHFLTPDLIIGESDNKKLYIIHRMMSEAFSLVFADMLYVDCLKESGIEYDYFKRKIYPIYTESLENNIDLETLLLANAEYVIFGDDTRYKTFTSDETLNNFKEKYTSFFIEDFKWTNENWKNIKKQDLSKWTEDLTEGEMQNTFTIKTFESIIANHDNNSIVEDYSSKEIFDEVFKYYLNAFTIKRHLTKTPIKNALTRYLIGQCALFSKYTFNNKVKQFYNKIKTIINNLNEEIDQREANNYKHLVSSFIKEMCNDNLISLDDYHTYKEVYPIFKPFYVFYDEDKSYYNNLKTLSNEILK